VTTQRLARQAVTGALVRVVAVVAAFVFATQRGISKPEFYEAAVWGLLVLAAFHGVGATMNALLFPSRRADPGLRAMWGASAMLFVGGVLAAASLFSRTAVLLLIDAGLLAYCVAAIRERRENARAARFWSRVALGNGLLAAMLGAVLLAALVFYAGGVADPTSNPYDDDVAYFPLVRRLIDTGTMIEPFSFRRLAALGGQTFYHALLSPHATYRQLNTFDRGMCVLLFVSLLVGHRYRGRRLPLSLTILVTGFFLALPNNSINSAAHYAGFAFFLAVFRTLVFLREEDGLLGKTLPVALVAIATCTLRQNYLSVPITTLGVVHLYRLVAAARARQREAGGSLLGTMTRENLRSWLREPVVLAGLAALVLVPWLVLAYRSNQTILFPLQNGTFRRALDLKSPTLTYFKELKFLFSVALENEPIKLLGVLALAGALVRDEHPYRPLRSFWIACAFGLVILSHTFTLSDAGNLARYLYGFFAALAAAVVLTVGTQRLFDRDGAAAARRRFVVGLAVAAMLVQYPLAREKSTRMYQTFLRNVDMQRRRTATGLDVMPHEAFLYGHVQSFVPAGKAMAIMVDDPYYFDFSKNPIFNIDMPGYSSIKPDMPYFEGPEPLAAYFLAHDIRYFVYVRPEFSHWLYQREFWFGRMFNEEEIWRICAPYFVDLIDNLGELRKSRAVLHEENGIVVLDLASRR